MKLTTFLISVTILFMFSACKEKEGQDKNRTQMQEVMDIHDEVMPKMGTIGKLVKQLKPKVDSTASGREYDKAVKDLQAAHQAMMDWMGGFGDRFDPDEILNGKELSGQKQNWLDEEEIKVKALRDQINSSIENAEALLEKE